MSRITASFYPLGDQLSADSAYSAIFCDGQKVVFATCSHIPGHSAQLFVFDLKTRKIIKKISMTGVVGKQHRKIHSRIVSDNNGNLYFATHFAYAYGLPQPMQYEGGILLCLKKDYSIENLGIVEPSNGIINIAIDNKRDVIYLSAIPSANLFEYNISQKAFMKLGQIPAKKSVCRDITLDKYGNLIGSYEDGGVFLYSPETRHIEFKNQKILPSRPYSQWNGSSRGGVNRIDRTMWRNISYDQNRDVFFGLHSSDSQIFSIDNKVETVEALGNFYPIYTKKERKGLIFPMLSMSADDDKLYYVSSNGLFDYCRSEKMQGYSHFMIYDKKKGRVFDRGIIEDEYGRKVFGVMASTVKDGTYYGLGSIEAKSAEQYNPFNIIDGEPFLLALIIIES